MTDEEKRAQKAAERRAAYRANSERKKSEDEPAYELTTYQENTAHAPRKNPPTLSPELAERKRKYTMSPAAIAARQKGGSSRGVALMNPNINKEVAEKKTNTKIIEFLLNIMANADGHSIYDVDGMRALFVEYVKLAHECNMPINNLGAYLAMGISKETAADWKHGRHGTPAHKELIQTVDRVCAAYRQTAVEEGKINAVWGIFASKNFDGMQSEPVPDVNDDDILAEAKDAESIRRKYETLPDD